VQRINVISKVLCSVAFLLLILSIFSALSRPVNGTGQFFLRIRGMVRSHAAEPPITLTQIAKLVQQEDPVPGSYRYRLCVEAAPVGAVLVGEVAVVDDLQPPVVVLWNRCNNQAWEIHAEREVIISCEAAADRMRGPHAHRASIFQLAERTQ